jgi:hypothetical protein
MESTPTPDARVGSVRPDNPLGEDSLTFYDRAVLENARNVRVPENFYAALLRVIDHALVQDRSTHAESASMGKLGFCRRGFIQEANPAENAAYARVHSDAQLFEGPKRSR